jgi:hypothetical protein
VSENLLLVHRAAGIVNGANVHRATALIRGYQNALDHANDARCQDRKKARQLVTRAENALRQFCEGGL